MIGNHFDAPRVKFGCSEPYTSNGLRMGSDPGPVKILQDKGRIHAHSWNQFCAEQGLTLCIGPMDRPDAGRSSGCDKAR